MAKIFTKLNLGDVVASSGGKCFKKLSTIIQLSAPTISIDGNTLTITDNSGLATSFDILVDGEVKYYAKYLYNGVLLPKIPEDVLADYPYCWIRKHTTNDQYQLVFASSPWYYKDGAMCCSDSSATEPWYNITISTANNATGWTFNKNTTGSFTVDDARPIMWSNHDIPNGSATATDIYFKGTPSDVVLTSATLDLTTLGLASGTYNITCKASANGYEESEQSNAVEYVRDISVNIKGSTWFVTSWTAIAGYASFNVEGYYDYNGNGRKYFTQILLGYSEKSVTKANQMSIYRGDLLASNIPNVNSSITFTFTGGTDVTNTKLIDWLETFGELQ